MITLPFRAFALALTVPAFLGGGCAWQSDLDALQKEFHILQGKLEKSNEQTLDTAMSASRTSEQAANEARRAAGLSEQAVEMARATNTRVARLFEKPESAVYTLEFGMNKSDVNFQMGRQIDDILKAWKGKAAAYQVVGHADMVGSKKFNLLLSQKRAQEVKAAMIRRGVSASLVRAQGVGEEVPAVSTKDGSRLRANRVVVVTVVPKES